MWDVVSVFLKCCYPLVHLLEARHPQHGCNSSTIAAAQPQAPGTGNGLGMSPPMGPLLFLSIPKLGLDEGLEACWGALFVSTLTPLFSL